MKLTFLIILCSLMTVAATVKSQDAKISLSLKNVAISKIIKEIERSTDYTFLYNNTSFPSNTKVSVTVTNETVANVLNQVLINTGFDFKLLNGDLIVITKYQPVNAPYNVSGSVTDENNKPLLGVTIKIKGQNLIATTTNDKGFFTIKVPDRNAVLEISYIGYVKQETSVDGKTTLIIRLKQALGTLQEVIVVGYGVQNKATITSAVSQVSGDELQKIQTPNLTQKLVGELPGLIGYNPSGEPGQDDAFLTVRGLSTTSSKAPLILVDGIVRFQISYIDPNDIESVSILKDAAATAVYGARAANGAILITTKRGKEGTTNVTYSGNFGISQAVNILKPLDSYTTALMINQAWMNEGYFAPNYYGSQGYNDAALNAIKDGTDPNRYSNVDWFKLLYGTSPQQQSHNVSISGGTQKGRFFISGGYLDQNGFWAASDLKRYNIRANLDGKIGNIFDYAVNISGRRQVYDNVSVSPNTNNLFLSPLFPVQYTTGNYHYDPNTGNNAYLVGRGDGGYNDKTLDIFESSVSLTYKVPFIPGLSIKGLYSFDNSSSFINIFSKPFITYQFNTDNSFSIPPSVSSAQAAKTVASNQAQSITSEFSLNYNKSFAKHNVTALLLYTETSSFAQSLTGTRTNFASSVLDQLSLGSTTGETNDGSASQSGRRSVVSRLGYNYKEKYLFEFDSRYDGSDLFPPGHRYGFFPAFSAGWRISEEPFIKNNYSFINNLKIRGSWGQAGNDSGGAFQYLSTYSISSTLGYSFGGVTGQTLTPGVIPNVAFTWELATTTNVGIDANLWGNLFGISADYFSKHTTNILGAPTAAVPQVLGGALPIGNYGIVDNKGFEIALTHQNTIGKVSYYINPNITFNNSKVVYYPEAASTPDATRITGKAVQTGAITGYLANGLYQSTAEITGGPTPLYASTKPGDIKYVDVNHDGKITAADQVLITSGQIPHTIVGLNIGATYNGFDFSILFQGAAGIKDVIPSRLFSAFGGAGVPIAFPFQQDNWTPSNPGATYPRLTIISRDNQDYSTYWVRDGSYLRMKNLQIGYNLPKEWLSKLHVGSSRLYISGSNLFTFSHLKGIMDPEIGASSTPLMKLYSVGINVKFN